MPQTRRPRGTLIADDVHRALRIRPAETGETMEDILDRALRKEMVMMTLTWQVLEDNGGGLHLAVFDGGDAIYYGYGYEYDNEDGLRAAITALQDGVDPRTDGWDMPSDVDDPQAWYDALLVGETGGARVVADQDGVYYDRMGTAARRALGDRQDRLLIEYHILGGNVLTESGDERGTYDEAASVAKLAEMTEAALKESFPRAAVEVTYELNVSGGDGRNLYVIDTEDDHMRYEPGDTGEGGRIADEARDVVGRVWESWEWVVYDGQKSS